MELRRLQSLSQIPEGVQNNRLLFLFAVCCLFFKSKHDLEKLTLACCVLFCSFRCRYDFACMFECSFACFVLIVTTASYIPHERSARIPVYKATDAKYFIA